MTAQLSASASGRSGIVIENWTPIEKNTLRGFVRAKMPSGVVFHDCSVHQQNGAWWVSPASKPMVGRDGMQMKDQAGKPLYTPVVSFGSKELRDKFSTAILDALRAAHPEVFDDGH
jgi:hypothetical protein